ncbi:unnamed protein product [Alopecurus aequalis]
MQPPSPPAYGYPYDGEERPKFVLIEPYAYFAVREDATTATCSMRGFKGEFRVTFCTAPPPLVSYMCFEATKYDHTAFAVAPKILATETNGGLVLLRVVFGNHPSAVMFPRSREYLVYDASGPSLTHLPHPGNLRFSDDSLAFLRPLGSTTCYLLVGHSGGFGYAQPTQLYLYRSDKKVWAVKPLDPSSGRVPCHSTSKAITIGGILCTVAWVDLWHSIITCDLLMKDPKLRSLELPQANLLDSETIDGNPRAFRDVAFLEGSGSFKYVEMQYPDKEGSPRFVYWEATVWSAKTSSSSAKDWTPLYKIKSSEIPEPSLPLPPVGPDEAQPAFSDLHIGLPNLSLQDAAMVYFLCKVHPYDPPACVLAVNMQKNTVEEVSDFCPMRTLGLSKGYSASSISNFLKGTKQNQKQSGTTLLNCPTEKPSSMEYAEASSMMM